MAVACEVVQRTGEGMGWGRRVRRVRSRAVARHAAVGIGIAAVVHK